MLLLPSGRKHLFVWVLNVFDQQLTSCHADNAKIESIIMKQWNKSFLLVNRNYTFCQFLRTYVVLITL